MAHTHTHRNAHTHTRTHTHTHTHTQENAEELRELRNASAQCICIANEYALVSGQIERLLRTSASVHGTLTTALLRVSLCAVSGIHGSDLYI